MGKRRLTGEDQERLHKAIRVTGASERAVLEIWNIVKDDEAPMGRAGFMSQVHLQLERWKRCLVPTTFSLLDGSTVDIPILNLQEALKAFCTDPDTAAFANALKKGLSQTGMVTPIIFADECTAGNVLAANKSRKAMIYNLSWLELWHLLKNQHAWLPVALVQSTCLNKLRGGASAIMLAILRQNVSAANVEGFPLNDGIFFRQNQEAWFLGDHDAVRAVFSLKGSAGLRPCVFCRNVVKAASGVVEIDEDFKEISAANGFDLASDSDIFRLCDSLLQPMSKKDREMKERCCGVTCSPETLLFDPSERLKMPPSRIMYDFMHTYLHNGCASREIHLFLTNIFSLTEVTREILQGAVVAAAWKATRSSGRNARYLEHLFADFMFGDETYKGQANETDAALPLVRFYMETMMVPGGWVPEPMIKSFRTLCDIVDFVKQVQHGLGHAVDEVSMTHLSKLQQLHQERFGKAYGMEYKPKHHRRLHLDSQYLRAKVIVSCEALEHKHSLYKGGLGDRQRSLIHDHGAFSTAILPRMLQTCHDLIRRAGLPFWELLPPIEEASMDDKISFATTELKTSKRSLESPDVFFFVMFGEAVCPLVLIP